MFPGTRVLFIVGLVLVGCGHDGGDDPAGSGSWSCRTAATSVDASAGADARSNDWVEACVSWLRGDCVKSCQCSIVPSADCAKSDEGLREVCRTRVNKMGCQKPDPASFDRCRRDTEKQRCDQYCAPGETFCFNFCFFGCLDPRP